MAVFRFWTLLLFAVVFARHSECRSTKADSAQSIDYEEESPTANFTPEDGVQSDTMGDVQADDGDEDDDEEPLPPLVLVSKPVNIHAAVGDTVWLPCNIVDPSNSSTAFVSWQHNENKLFSGTLSMLAKLYNNSKIIIHSNWSIEIPSVNTSDSGTYTCELISSDQQVVHHNVRVSSSSEPPSIKRMLPESASDRRVVEGTRLVITCEADGMPKPTLIWSRTSGITKATKRIGTSDGVRFERDSIVIDSVQREDEGEYFCMAENKVGKPALRSVRIQVVGKPSVHVHQTLVNGAVGVTVILGCTVNYEPRSTVRWMKDDQELNHSADIEIQEDYPSSIVRIPQVKEKDFGTYTCIARNQYGEHKRSASLVEEPVVVEPLKVDYLAIQWEIHSHLPLEDVMLEYRRVGADNDEWKRVNVKTRPSLEKHIHWARFELTELADGKYEARSRARNERGWSTHTHSVFFERAKEEPNPESIQQAGVGGSFGNGGAELKSLAFATIILCSLGQFV